MSTLDSTKKNGVLGLEIVLVVHLKKQGSYDENEHEKLEAPVHLQIMLSRFDNDENTWT